MEPGETKVYVKRFKPYRWKVLWNIFRRRPPEVFVRQLAAELQMTLLGYQIMPRTCPQCRGAAREV